MVRIRSLAVHSLLYLLYTASFLLLMMTDALAEGPLPQFNLPSEPLPKALIDFSHQCGVQTAFSATPQIDNAKSNPVTGVMSSSMALQLLLKDTGYTYFPDTDNSVDIVPVEQPPDGERQAAVVARGATTGVAQSPAVEQDPGGLEQVNVTGSLIHGVQDVVAQAARDIDLLEPPWVLFNRRALGDPCGGASCNHSGLSLPIRRLLDGYDVDRVIGVGKIRVSGIFQQQLQCHGTRHHSGNRIALGVVDLRSRGEGGLDAALVREIYEGFRKGLGRQIELHARILRPRICHHQQEEGRCIQQIQQRVHSERSNPDHLPNRCRPVPAPKSL